MTRRVFFSFHYERDIWRVNVVRNCWLTQDREVAGFWDASLWETAKKNGDAAIKRIIDSGLANTSVTVVLIGAETASRNWVTYEIKESYRRGNGLLGVYIDGIKDRNGYYDLRGSNPFNKLWLNNNGRTTFLSSLYPTYSWLNDEGFKNFGNWVETAARAAGR